VNELDRLYVTLLYHGLIAIRNASHGGDLEYCKAESEHLHEVPSLIGETNILRHVYQATAARGLYLEWVESNNRDDVREFIDIWYAPVWRDIDAILANEQSRQS